MPKSLIDTSVIADWLLISLKIKELKKMKKNEEEIANELKIIWDKYPKSKAAYELLEAIRKANRSYKNFLMCDFSSPEIFNVLFKEYMDKKLSSLPYRFRERARVISSIKFNSKESNEILDVIIDFFKTFFEKKKMTFVELSLGKEIGILFDLIFIDRCHVTDAVLISTAIDNICKYFITQDDEIIRKLKRKKEIKAISPSEFLSRFKRKII